MSLPRSRQILLSQITPTLRPLHAATLFRELFGPRTGLQQAQLGLDLTHLGPLLGGPAGQVRHFETSDQPAWRDPVS